MTEYYGSCHCKEVRFSFFADEILDELYQCNCTLCLKKAIVMKPISKDHFTLQNGHSNLYLYEWNKKIAKHFFCKICGVYTHHVRRREPSQISINIMCVDDILITPETKINLIDGASHD
jgi:hypothetical protein